MYAIVKTGGKQYRVSAGDALNIEKVTGNVGDKVALTAICVVDGAKVISDPKAAAGVKVEAEIVEQFKDKKVIVFKFKKRKNYQRKVGHRQQLTRVRILSVGDEKASAAKSSAKKPAAKKTADAKETKSSTKTSTAKKATATKTATAEKKPATKKTSAKTSATDKKPAAKKTTAAKKTDKPADSKADKE